MNISETDCPCSGFNIVAKNLQNSSSNLTYNFECDSYYATSGEGQVLLYDKNILLPAENWSITVEMANTRKTYCLC